MTSAVRFPTVGWMLVPALWAASAAAEDKADGPWPAPVPGWTAPAPGEHPRLFFRKADLPELRRRAATPEGRALVARLKVLLGGGEEMPKVFNGSGKAYEGNKAKTDGGDDKGDAGKGGKTKELPLGAYTVSHAAGFGMLYQLTGDKKYADLGRQCFEKAFEGVRDRDDRYSWKVPGGALRAGPSLGWYAVGYDLCHDGWDEDFRRRVAKELQDYDQGPHMDIASMAAGKRHGPGSNHWGPEIAGPALALLAIRGDAGTDAAKVDKLLAVSEKSFLRQLTEGWGDHGWFAEGDGPGTISSDTAFVPALLAWKVAGGKDFVTPRPNAQWLTLKFVMLTLPVPGATKAAFPYRGVYDHNVFSRVGMSGSGTFSQGFGAVADEYKPALLWLYNRTFRDADAKADAPFDTVSPYPARAILALVNWPFGLAEKNPGEVLPRAVLDKRFAFAMFRNRWQDADDIVVTALLKGSKGNYSVKGGEILVWGLGRKTKFPVSVTGDIKDFRATEAGGAWATSAGSFGADFSGAGGADAVLVLSGPLSGGGFKGGGQDGVITVQAGANTFTVMTLQKGAAPEIRADGEKLQIGGQTVSLENGLVTFAKTKR